MSADEIAHAHNLTVAQVYAALTYAFEHIDEMQAEMREEEELVAAAMKRHLFHPPPVKTDGSFVGLEAH
jgi:hypothetical protein